MSNLSHHLMHVIDTLARKERDDDVFKSLSLIEKYGVLCMYPYSPICQSPSSLINCIGYISPALSTTKNRYPLPLIGLLFVRSIVHTWRRHTENCFRSARCQISVISGSLWTLQGKAHLLYRRCSRFWKSVWRLPREHVFLPASGRELKLPKNFKLYSNCEKFRPCIVLQYKWCSSI